MAAGDYIIRRARVQSDNKLEILLDAEAARSGTPRLDITKLSITTDSPTPLGFAVVPSILSLSGTTGTAWWSYPNYATDGNSSVPALLSVVPLNRKVKQSENLTLTGAAGAFYDDNSDSPAFPNFLTTVHTFVDDDNEVSHHAMRRVGCGNRPKTDPETLAPSLVIYADDFAADGDGNIITARAVTVGGTVTPTGSIRYRADGVAGGQINGSTGCPVLEIPAGGVLTTTVNLGASKADYTILVMHAFAGTSGNITVTGASIRCNVGDGGDTRSVQNVGTISSGFNMGGFINTAAASPQRRLMISGGSYRDNAPGFVGRVYGYGGMRFRQVFSETPTQNHGVNITITANTTTAYIAAIVVIPNAPDATVTTTARRVGAFLDDRCNTTNNVYFIDPATGSDSNSGLTEGAPLLSLPNMNANPTSYCVYGAGDIVCVKYGTDTNNVSIFNRPAFDSTYGYSSEFPHGIGGYGNRADGYWRLVGKTVATDVETQLQNAYMVVWGIHLDQQRRNPLNTDGDYLGYPAAKSASGGSFRMSLQNAPIATVLGDPSLDPPMTYLYDCKSSFCWKQAFIDSNGFHTAENYHAVKRCVVDRNWKDTLDGAEAVGGPSGFFFATSTFAILDECFGYYIGSWFEPASIGGHTLGVRTFTAEASATYSAGTNRTTVTLAGAFTQYVPGGSDARGIAIVKRTSNATEIGVEIFSKTSNDEIVLTGNPFGLADAATITDVLLFGGFPSAPDARHHFRYDTSNASGVITMGGSLSINCISYEAASNGFQHRHGGWVVDNIIVDAAIAGFVGGFDATQFTGVMDGNLVEGGRRLYSQVFTGVRCWGIQIVDELATGILQNNILNQSPTGFGSQFGIEQNGGAGAFLITNVLTDGAYTRIIRNNTEAKKIGRSLFMTGNANSIKDINRNIFQGDATYGPGWAFTGADTELNATYLRNTYYSPDGAVALRFDENTINFASWQALTGSTAELFSETTFAGDPIPISLCAEYYATLPGGTNSKQDWLDAVMAAYDAGGDLGVLSVPNTLAYARTRVRPTNRTLAEGDGILMGAVALASPPPPTPHAFFRARDRSRRR